MSRIVQSIEVKNVKFSIDTLELELTKHKPGTYKIAWHTKTNIWDMFVKWDGSSVKDLHQLEE